ncbi:hypothetical protein [Methyloversatilis sp.]
MDLLTPCHETERHLLSDLSMKSIDAAAPVLEEFRQEACHAGR